MLSPPPPLAASTRLGRRVEGGCRVVGPRRGLASAAERGGAGEDMRDLGVVEVAGEAVRGEQVEVAGLGGMGRDFGLDLGLRADGAGDDVADGRDRRPGCGR